VTLGAAADGEAAPVALAVWPLPGSALPGALLAVHAATLTVTSKPIMTSMPFLLMILRIPLPPALFPRPVMLMLLMVLPAFGSGADPFQSWDGWV
jgi:hypothetical protein